MPKKIKMLVNEEKSLEEVFDLWLLDCAARGCRPGTITHYKDAIKQIYKLVPEETPVSQIGRKEWDNFRIKMNKNPALKSSVSAYTYCRDFKTILRFGMKQGFLERFELQLPSVDKQPTETYTEEELAILLKKPNLRQCNFTEYKSWVIVNFLLSTGIRQNSLINIKVKDVDFETGVVHINITKNRKPLIIPMNSDIQKILKEYLSIRRPMRVEDWLFCNQFGQQLNASTLYAEMWNYNKNRGVEKTGIHRYRHTYAKEWVLMGGNVVSLQKVLGHSSLEITQNYLNILVSDIEEDMDEFNILRHIKGEAIKMK